MRTQHEVALRAALASLAAGTVASRLGSPDPRDAAREGLLSAGIVASRLGSPDPQDTDAVAAVTNGQGAVGSADGGFSWRDAGIGAGAALLAIVVLASAFLGIRHTRRRIVSPA